MIQITQIKLSYGHTDLELENKIKKILRLTDKQKFTYKIVKKSIDARKKPELFLVYTCLVSCENEKEILKRAKDKSISIVTPKTYQCPSAGNETLNSRPLIIGAGPAGLFAAYLLSIAGFKPIVMERGKNVEQRQLDVEEFFKTGVLNPSSNVQFGEGGAGTFSDGKLNTVVKDPAFRNQFVLETFVRFGAPNEITYENKPHIGTDILCKVIKNMRAFMEQNGVSFLFETCVTDFNVQNGRIVSVEYQTKELKKETLPVSVVVLALGHSARDTFKTLEMRNIPMEAKNFAVGFRVEHPQEMINEALYGKQEHPLPAAPYKITANFPNGRGVYSFCMCPGGYVVNSSSEEQRLVVNGMSYSQRDSSTANSAIIVSVSTEDFGNHGPLSGMYFQQTLEEKAFQLANGKIPQQLYGDFCENKSSTSYGTFSSNTKGQSAFVNLRGLFSKDIEESFINGMEHFANIIPDFNRKDAILSGVESRTSSPIRILREENFESSVKGLYPCGEGAGYAGGITSAAMDGIKVAEAIIKKYNPN